MNTIIRKLSVGKDYPNGSIHYQVGSIQNLKGNKYKITSILLDRDQLQFGKLSYNIYVSNEPTTEADKVYEILWKTVQDVPVVVENNIDFD